jgi:hypothetical protein
MAVYDENGILLRLIVPTYPCELDDPAHSAGGIPVRVPIAIVKEAKSHAEMFANVNAEAVKLGVKNPRMP